MSKVYTNPVNYTNIAEAIRTKLDNEENYKPAEMAEAILSIETEPVINALTVMENGTYTAPEGVDGYSPVVVNVSGGGDKNANIHWYCPKICVGDPQINLHSDCELKDEIASSDYTKTSNILSLSRTDKLNLLLTLDKDNMDVGDTVEFKGNFTIYRFNNGTASTLSKTVAIVSAKDTYEPLSGPDYLKRDILPRMAVVRNTYLDDGEDTITFTNYFRGVGFGSTATNVVVVSSNSYVRIGNLTININQRDAGVYYIWKEEGDCDSIEFMKVRWKGCSAYGGAIDQEWEVVLLTNGDVILRMIKLGTNSGSFTFNGTSYSIGDNQVLCFYRGDYFGTQWNITLEEYDYNHHVPAADNLFAPGTFAEYASTLDDGIAIINNVAHDDDTVTYGIGDTFTWHGGTYIAASGNSFMGVGSTSEEIKMHRRDAKMYYLYVLYLKLTDMNNMRAVRYSWRGASHYSGSIDRWWTLWLFENGDAMIYISTVGGNTGESSFYGQSYTANNNSFISFYYDSSAGNYDIKYEQYTLEHHIG